MKLYFLAFRQFDPQLENKGGSTEIVLKAINDNALKTKEQIDGIKTEVSASLEKAKTEINGKVDDLDTRVGEVKAENQKLTVKVDEMDKKMATAGTFGGQPKNDSFDARLKEAVETNTDNINKFIKGESKKLSIEIKGVDHTKAVGAVSVANVTGTTVFGAQSRPGIIMNPNTMTHLRTLLPVAAAGPGTDYYFMRENGAGEGSIAPTSETTAAAAATTQATGLKPQFDVDLVEASVKFETIAGWMLMSRRAMNNVPGLLGFLQRRIPEKLMEVEDAQILYGDGTSPNIKGILVAGNYVASTSTATVLAEAIIDDLSLLEDTYKRIANGIALRPADYFSFFKNKATGSGEYDLPQGVVFVNGVLYILGVPVAKTTALTAGDYVVGDFVQGAELLVQEAMRLEFFEQDSTNVRTNQITVRIEESIALPVYGSDYFIKGAVPA